VATRRFLIVLFSAGAAAADGGVATFTDPSLGPTSLGGAISAGATAFVSVLDSLAVAAKPPLPPESIVGSTIGFGYLLMNQIQIANSRLSVSIQFKEFRLSDQFVSCRNGVIARVSNISGPIFSELGSTELEQADIGARALLRIKIRLDFGYRLHKARVQTERIGSSLDLFNRRSHWNISQRI
jgi:hypothetical protein